jgi:hypothetical protein
MACRGQSFAEPAERFMKQHTRSEKHRAASTEAWGVPASLEDVKFMFGKYLSPASCPFPWAEGALPLGCAALIPQMQKMIDTGFLPINALAQVCCACTVWISRIEWRCCCDVRVLLLAALNQRSLSGQYYSAVFLQR